MKGLDSDVAMQTLHAQISLRRNLTEKDWQEHAEHWLKSTTKPERRAEVEQMLQEADRSFKANQAAIQKLKPDIAKELGLPENVKRGRSRGHQPSLRGGAS